MSDVNRPIMELPVKFSATDGYELAGVYYVPQDEFAIRSAAVFNCGAGICATRYAHFARYLAANGIATLLYDYRGMGMSRSSPLRGFRAGMEDWSQRDTDAAIAWLRKRCTNAPLIGIAHSIGAFLFGGTRRSSELSRFVFIAPHTGYWRDYTPRYRLPMVLLWHAFMPVATRACGFFPGAWLRLGEDIPAGAALQWAARTTAEFRPDAVSDHADPLRTAQMLEAHRSLRGPALVVCVTDDAFATEQGAVRLLNRFPGLDVQRVRVSPADAGVAAIGHFGFFRRRTGASLWPRLVGQIEAMAGEGSRRERA